MSPRVSIEWRQIADEDADAAVDVPNRLGAISPATDEANASPATNARATRALSTTAAMGPLSCIVYIHCTIGPVGQLAPLLQ